MTEPTELERAVADAIRSAEPESGPFVESDLALGEALEGFDWVTEEHIQALCLAAARAAIAECFRWRSLTEGRPPDCEPVLLHLPDADKGLPGCEVAQWWGGDEPGACWWTNGGPNAGSDMDEWSNATHWMPLPPLVIADSLPSGVDETRPDNPDLESGPHGWER